jgi:hypothetical protein
MSPRFLKVALLLACIVSCGAFLLMLALRIKLTATVNSDIGGVEQNVVYALQLMLDGKSPYPDPAALPFYINQYTPAYLYVCYLVALITGAGTHDIHQLYLIGRIWTLLFNILAMLALYRIALKFFRLPQTLAIFLGCASFVFIYRQGFCARADSMMDACMLWAIYYFLDFINGGNLKHIARLWLPFALASLSIFVKQSGVQLPAIMLGFLLFYCPFKTFLRATGIAALLFVVPFAALTLYYGEPFLKHVVGGVDNGISYLWVKNFLWGNGLKTKVILPALICGYILIVRLGLFRGPLSARFLSFCAGSMFLFNAAISFKAGSNIQYFFVFTNLSLLLIVYYFFGRYYTTGEKLRGFYQHAAAVFSTGFVFMLMLANLAHQVNWIKQVEFDQKPVIVAKEKAAARVAAFVRSRLAPGHYVFANLSNEREDLSYCGRRGINNLLYGLCAVPGLDVLDVSTVRSKVFGYTNFSKNLQEGTISHIIEGSPANKSGIPDLDETRSRYFKPVKEMDGYTVYEYTGPAD